MWGTYYSNIHRCQFNKFAGFTNISWRVLRQYTTELGTILNGGTYESLVKLSVKTTIKSLLWIYISIGQCDKYVLL